MPTESTNFMRVRSELEMEAQQNLSRRDSMLFQHGHQQSVSIIAEYIFPGHRREQVGYLLLKLPDHSDTLGPVA